MKTLRTALLATSVAVLAAPVWAYETGDVLVRFGPAFVAPNDSSDSTLGDVVEVDDSTGLGISATYMVRDDIGVELLGALPFAHTVNGTGALDGVKIGKVEQLPPTVLVHYAPKLSDKFQPYAGVGFNYTTFFHEKTSGQLDAAVGGSTSLSLGDSTGLALELGCDVPLRDNLIANLSVWNIDINSKASVYVDGAKAATIDVQIDPWVYMLGLGVRF